MECFIPMQTKTISMRGREVKREMPLALNYVFIRSEDFLSARNMLHNFPQVSMLYNKPYKDAKKDSEESRYRPMIASDVEMEMFIKAASFYTQGVPFEVPDRKLMEKGDIVRIIGGPFKGVEGVLITQQGKDGGKVVVSISNLISVSTIDIAPEFIQVIKFAHGNKHIYKKMDSFKPRVEKALEKQKDGVPLSEEEHSQIEEFIHRFSAVKTETVNTEAKLSLLIFKGYRALGMEKQARAYYGKIQEDIFPKVKSEKVKDTLKKELNDFLKK